MKLLKKYRFFIITSIILILILLLNKELGLKAIRISGNSLKEMIFMLPPIFILMGLLDVWIPREIMIKYMGEESGIVGIVLAFLFGSAAAGPLYGAFPIAAVFMKKGVKFTNVLIFIGAWSTTKIPMFLFEMASLGSKFAITRLLVDISGIIIISYLLASTISTDELHSIYERAKEVD